MSNQPKHSPGPWFWDDKDALPWTDYDETIHAPFLMDANGSIVMSGDDIRIRNEADGVLITKAGEMAEEIERLKQENAELLDALKRIYDLPCDCPCEVGDDTISAYDQARAAIAKAEVRGV